MPRSPQTKACCAGPHPDAPLSELTGRLRDQAVKITGPRQAILEVLRQHRRPHTNKEILAALPEGECDLATIYRSMHLLEKMGMVKRFDFGDSIARFELVSEIDGGHHHHLVCTRCGVVVAVNECFPEDFEQRVAVKAGFKAVTHRLEFFGTCPDCQSAPGQHPR